VEKQQVNPARRENAGVSSSGAEGLLFCSRYSVANADDFDAPMLGFVLAI
jgi:hypothetical protein